MKKVIVSIFSLTLLFAFALPISSFATSTKSCVTLYEHANFKGKHKQFCGTHNYVGDEWNDIASSAIFTVKPGETIVLWEHSLDSKKNNHGFGVTKSKKIAKFNASYNDKISAVEVHTTY